MSLVKKLNLKEGQKVRVVNAPTGFKLDAATSTGVEADAVLVFVKDSKEFKAKGKPAFDAARADRIAWIVYPKAGQLGTDLNRDVLWKAVESQKIKPVRNVAIDDVWSALRFRPA